MGVHFNQMFRISKGDIEFLYAMNQCHQKDLGSIVHIGTWHEIINTWRESISTWHCSQKYLHLTLITKSVDTCHYH